MSQAQTTQQPQGAGYQLLGREAVMTRSSDIKWIVAQSMFATLLILAWAYIPA
jgi:hypothetical protein